MGGERERERHFKVMIHGWIFLRKANRAKKLGGGKSKREWEKVEWTSGKAQTQTLGSCNVPKMSRGKVVGSTMERPGTVVRQVPMQPANVWLSPAWPNPTAEKNKELTTLWVLMGLRFEITLSPF